MVIRGNQNLRKKRFLLKLDDSSCRQYLGTNECQKSMKPNVNEAAAESSHQSSKCALLFIITILSPQVNDHQCFITHYHLDNFQTVWFPDVEIRNLQSFETHHILSKVEEIVSQWNCI